MTPVAHSGRAQIWGKVKRLDLVLFSGAGEFTTGPWYRPKRALSLKFIIPTMAHRCVLAIRVEVGSASLGGLLKSTTGSAG